MFDFKEQIDLFRVRHADAKITAIMLPVDGMVTGKFADLAFTEDQINQLGNEVIEIIKDFTQPELAMLLLLGKISFLRRVGGMVNLFEQLCKEHNIKMEDPMGLNDDEDPLDEDDPFGVNDLI